jgi:Methyltransferase domain
LAADGSPSDARRRFDAAAAVLLDRGAEPVDLYRAAHELYAVLAGLTGIREDSRERAEIQAIQLPGGVALAPRDAARSVLDFMRTARMLQGLEAGIAAARERFGSPVDVLYAGCGPFAPLALPLAARLGSQAARFTLMDVHEVSVALARRTTEALGLGESVRAYVHADATTWTSPAPLQVVVAEALERALEREPQVAIMANLAPQLAPGGLVVPERISVEACLADASREVLPVDDPGPARLRVPLGTVFSLTAESARALRAQQGVPEVVLPVGAIAAEGPSDLMLRTIVTAFGDVVLEEYESGITYPAFLLQAGRMRGGTRLRFRYDAGPDPRFRCSLEAV